MAGMAIVAAVPFAAAPCRADDFYSFLGALTLPNQASLENTVIGGLSGITYDAANGRWLLLSDDKSEHGPARFYTAEIRLSDGLLSTVRFTGMTPLKSPEPASGSGPALDIAGYVDPEGIAIDGVRILWTSEDSWKATAQNTLKEASLDGVTTRDYTLPESLLIDFAKRTGPRDNNGLEAVAVTPDGSAIWLGVESPLVQDAALPDAASGAPTRLTKLDRNSGKLEAQYVYMLEHRARAALPGKHADGPGMTELAAIDDTHLLAMERSWVEGVTNFVQIYLVDTAGGTDVSGLASLKAASFTPVKKTLLIDLNALGIQMDNYEGMALGPPLADGRRLVLVSVDNNFNRHEKTIIAAFAVDLKAAMLAEGSAPTKN